MQGEMVLRLQKCEAFEQGFLSCGEPLTPRLQEVYKNLGIHNVQQKREMSVSVDKHWNPRSRESLRLHGRMADDKFLARY